MAKTGLTCVNVDPSNSGKRKAEESVDIAFLSLRPVVTARPTSRAKFTCTQEQTHENIVQHIALNAHDKVVEEANENTEGCETPKSEEHSIPEVLECPPAPKKPRPTSKRKSAPPPGGFYVPPGLDSIFLPLKKTFTKRIFRPATTAAIEVAQRSGHLKAGI
eukprot:Gb_23788 [translate_table: standard]